VSADYFKTMGIPLVQGRDFSDRDVRYEPIDQTVPGPPPYKVAIVNESFARRYFRERSPIGRHIGFGMNPGTKTPIEIIGVVKDAKYTGVRDEIPRQVFFAFLEAENNAGVIYVRTNAQPDSTFAAIRQTVREMDANVPIYSLRTLEHQIDQSLLNDRIVATLSTAFAALATLLAVIGLYGVMAYTVARRTREIGVRMALGALPANVVWMVMREVLLLVGVGLGLGLTAAWGLSRVVTAQLYGLTATDPLTIVAAAGSLALVALLAGYIPAIRATRINPVRALRYE
jgi:predicted permease